MEFHKAKIFGFKERRKRAYNYIKREFYNYLETVEEVLIWEGELENPVVKEKDQIFIPKLNTNLIIDGVAKSVEGGYRYYTSYVTEIVDDEETLKSYEEALKDKEKNDTLRLINLANRKEPKGFFKTNRSQGGKNGTIS